MTRGELEAFANGMQLRLADDKTRLTLSKLLRAAIQHEYIETALGPLSEAATASLVKVREAANAFARADRERVPAPPEARRSR